MKRSTLSLLCCTALLAASAAPVLAAQDDTQGAAAQAAKANPFNAAEVARFNEPWAMTFLPNGRLLVTEKRGALKVLTIGSSAQTITGVPAVAYGGQGGLGDVILHPSYATNGLIYISYAEKGSASGTAGATVARAKLNLTSSGGSLSNLQIIWRQPKLSGSNHYGHRLAFGPDRKLWITSSERQKFDPAQDLNSPLGKVIRLNDDGSVPTDNPFYSRGGVAATVWSYGHRNLLGIAFDAQNKLWIHEMGPKGGDELNLIERGSNYGWPLVSQGDHYDGTPIPRHSTRPDLNAPEAWWNPVIAPAGFVIYSGTRFPAWAGSGLIGGLASQALVRVKFNGNTAAEAERYPMGKRIREVEQGPNGDVWLLEDGTNARLLRLTPI
ncbi:PQQ-dependent sugar dehydrogenase [Pseudomonas sp. CGJS7]|uniref:PQQ-dependent sugar dehydrogenase n=1 Tax=Pseudomonas sp. CGJS7 TaxID=3109348 RepID=UPI00300BBE53